MVLFITACCEKAQKLVGPIIYLSAKFDIFSNIVNFSMISKFQFLMSISLPITSEMPI